MLEGEGMETRTRKNERRLLAAITIDDPRIACRGIGLGIHLPRPRHEVVAIDHQGTAARRTLDNRYGQCVFLVSGNLQIKGQIWESENPLLAACEIRHITAAHHMDIRRLAIFDLSDLDDIFEIIFRRIVGLTLTHRHVSALRKVVRHTARNEHENDA